MATTRIAPSPTGALHLGNARTFLVNWLLARQSGWKIILRIEDLDGPRIKKNAAEEAMFDLRWLGLDWDEGPVYQSSRAQLYSSAINELLKKSAAYPCVCSRREAELAASAPHAEDGAAVYPGTCRGRFQSIAQARQASGRQPAIRFQVPDTIVEFQDGFHGLQRFDAKAMGDFVIAKADGSAAYQIAVVVDDADMNVTDVIRGDDLLDSTARQILLYNALGIRTRPRWTHLPLVVGSDGKRLAKRHGDTRLSYYRDNGVDAGRVRTLLARWSGIACGDTIGTDELLRRFSLEKLPREQIVFRTDDDAWLTGKSV